MKQEFLFLTILFSACGSVFAQYDYEDDDLKKKPKAPKDEVKKPDDGKGFDIKKMSIGGAFNFSYGGGYFDGITEYTSILNLEISPIVAYQVIEDRLDLGAGVIYQFQRYNAETIYGFRYKNNTNTVGGRVFPRVYIFEGLFAQLEYVIWNGDVSLVDQTGVVVDEARLTFHNAFLGGGYKFPVGDNSYFTLLASVNLNTNLLYPKRQLFLSFGFGIGL